jgi:hypothetical protein
MGNILGRHEERLLKSLELESKEGKPSSLKDIFVAEWANIGLVAALLSGFCYSGFQSPPTVNDAPPILRDIFGVLMGTGFAANLASVLTATFLFVNLNAVEENFQVNFMESIVQVLWFPRILLIVGCACYFVGLCMLL